MSQVTYNWARIIIILYMHVVMVISVNRLSITHAMVMFYLLSIQIQLSCEFVPRKDSHGVLCFYINTLGRSDALMHRWCMSPLAQTIVCRLWDANPDSKVHGANMGSCRPQMGPMLAPWTLPSGKALSKGDSLSTKWDWIISAVNQHQCRAPSGWRYESSVKLKVYWTETYFW